MANKKQSLPGVSDHALEWVMHDMLNGLLELSMVSTSPAGGNNQCEIIHIQAGKPVSDPDGQDTPENNKRQAQILPFPGMRGYASDSC